MVVEIQGENTHFDSSTTVVEFPATSGIQVVKLEVLSALRADLTISISSGGPTGAQTLTVTTGSEEVTAEFEVVEGPRITISPEQAEQGQQGLEVMVLGDGTHFGVRPFGVEVTIPGVTVDASEVLSETEAKVVLSVDSDAVVGFYPGSFMVTTDYQTLTSDFTISQVLPRAIKIDPDHGTQGEEVTVEVSGFKTVFDPVSTSVEMDPGSGVEVADVRVVSATLLEAELRVHTDAVLGDHVMTVTDTVGPLYATFRVDPDPTPPQVTFSPDAAFRGDVVEVLALGTDTHFEDHVTWVEVEPEGQGLFMEVLAVDGPEQARLRATIGPEAEVRTYVVTLHTLAEQVSGQFSVLDNPLSPMVTIDPDSGRQGETVLVFIQGTNTHFNTGTEVSLPAGSGVAVTGVQVSGPQQAQATLNMSEEAVLGGLDLVVSTPSESEDATAMFTVLSGVPYVVLDPTTAEQGQNNVTVHAQGHYIPFNETTTIQPSSGCLVTMHDIVVQNTKNLTFQVDVPYNQPIGDCTFVFESTLPEPKQATASLQILGGFPVVEVPGDATGFVDGGPVLYGVSLGQGDVLKARVIRDMGSSIDPVLSLFGPDGDLANPLAVNDDESVATYNSLVVYQAPSTGMYFLVVEDRLNINSGFFTMYLDWYEPTSNLESQEPNNDLSHAEPMTARYLRAGFYGSDTFDFFEIASSMTGLTRVAVQVIARAVSPYETSASDVILRIYDPSQAFLAESSTGTDSPDPMLYVDTALLGYISLENEGMGLTTYWLNIRPNILINELFHDEENDWEAGFVEIAGEPGHDLSGCHLLGKAHDGLDETQVFDIDLTGYELNPAGFLVIAHDDLVPGTGPQYIKPELSIPDPGGGYTSIGVFLTCSGQRIDAVCYRGNMLAGCEGSAAEDEESFSLGRGFMVDTDENGADFMAQLEPSPWARNLTEVRP